MGIVSAVLRRLDRGLERRLGGDSLVLKLCRYGAASVVGVVTSQTVLLVGLIGFGLDAVPANIIATVLGAIPNYLVNRAWTWRKRGAHRLWGEIVPFWTMALLGLVLSTFAVRWADVRFDGNILAVSAANIGSFGVLWLAKFFVLDRVLFAPVAEIADDHEPE